MAAYLLDTNILLRSSDPNSPWQDLADASVTQLLAEDHQLWVTGQNITEFWGVHPTFVDVLSALTLNPSPVLGEGF